MQRKMFIAVMVLGIASLIYWAMRIQDYEVSEPIAAETQSEPVAATASASSTPLASEVTSTPQTKSAAAKARTSAAAPPPIPTAAVANSVSPPLGSPIPEGIPLTPGHSRSLAFMRQMNIEEPFTKLHDKLSNEGRDPDWAYATEQTLNNFFLSRSSQLGIEVPTIACRTSGCEVQMTTTQKSPLFDRLMIAAREESWYATFTAHPGTNSFFDGVGYFWLILERKTP